MWIGDSYILSRIAEKEGIKVTDQELSRQIAAIAAQQKVKPQKLAQQLKDNGTLYQVKEEIMKGKVIALLEEKAKVTENQPKQEEENNYEHERAKEEGNEQQANREGATAGGGA